MLSTLARIAAQLENDGHFDLADSADEIITAIANRDSHRYEAGELWSDHVEDMEASQEEQIEEAGLSVHESDEGPAELGMVGVDTYSTVLGEHQEAFKRYLRAHELTRQMVGTQAHRNVPVVPNHYIEEMVEELRAIFDELAASGTKMVEWDPEFDETARRLIESVGLEALAVPN